MYNYQYFKERGHILFLDSLEVIELNETAQLVFDALLQNELPKNIAARIADEYGLTQVEALEDVQQIIQTLKLKGIALGAADVAKKNAWQLHTAIVHINESCNSACKMCDCWRAEKPRQHSRADLAKFFNEIAKQGAACVMISGGEPLLHPELSGIIIDAKRAGLQVELNTNGIMLARATRLSDSLPERIIISLDGFDAETYRLYRGVNRYNQIREAIRQTAARWPEVKIGLRVTLNRHTSEQIEVAISLLDELPIESIGFSPADVSSNSFSRESMSDDRSAELKNLLIPELETLDDLLKKFAPETLISKKVDLLAAQGRLSWQAEQFRRCFKFYKNIRMGVALPSDTQPCYFPNTSLLLDYDGSIKRCFYSDGFASLSEVDNTDWGLASDLSSLVEQRKCVGCRGKIFCGGGN